MINPMTPEQIKDSQNRAGKIGLACECGHKTRKGNPFLWMVKSPAITVDSNGIGRYNQARNIFTVVHFQPECKCPSARLYATNLPFNYED